MPRFPNSFGSPLAHLAQQSQGMQDSRKDRKAAQKQALLGLGANVGTNLLGQGLGTFKTVYDAQQAREQQESRQAFAKELTATRFGQDKELADVQYGRDTTRDNLGYTRDKELSDIQQGRNVESAREARQFVAEQGRVQRGFDSSKDQQRFKDRLQLIAEREKLDNPMVDIPLPPGAAGPPERLPYKEVDTRIRYKQAFQDRQEENPYIEKARAAKQVGESENYLGALGVPDATKQAASEARLRGQDTPDTQFLDKVLGTRRTLEESGIPSIEGGMLPPANEDRSSDEIYKRLGVLFPPGSTPDPEVLGAVIQQLKGSGLMPESRPEPSGFESLVRGLYGAGKKAATSIYSGPGSPWKPGGVYQSDPNAYENDPKGREMRRLFDLINAQAGAPGR